MSGFDKTETFTLTMPASHRAATVYYRTEDGVADLDNGFGPAVAGVDYLAAAGSVAVPAGATTATFTVVTRSVDPLLRRCRFAVAITAGNGAKIETPIVHGVIPGWVGLLDLVGVVDGNTALPVPGLVGVIG